MSLIGIKLMKGGKLIASRWNRETKATEEIDASNYLLYHFNDELEIEDGVEVLPYFDDCPLPDIDEKLECPVGTQKTYVGSTKLISNNANFAGPTRKNGFALGPGTYIVEIANGSFSPWNNNVGANGPWIDGWWPGLTWLSKVNIQNYNNNQFEKPRIFSGYFKTKQEAGTAGKGLFKIIEIDWKNGEKNLFLWLADDPIYDNRDEVNVNLYYCNAN